jgi:hypothetical protein
MRCWRGGRAWCTGMPDPPSGVECPYIGAPPRVQWRRAGGCGSDIARTGLLESSGLVMRRRDMRAVTASHQHTILGFTQIRDTHGEPYSNSRQRNRKSQRSQIRQHALAKVVRFISRLLVTRQVVRVFRSVLPERVVAFVTPPVRRMSCSARPKPEHAVLFFRRDGLLVFHCCQLRHIVNYVTCFGMRASPKFTWRECDNLSL